MFRKEVSGRTVAIATVLILGIVQFIYWRLLVYSPPTTPGEMGGAPPGPSGDMALGLEDVEVGTLAGDVPGYADGPPWKAQFCGPNALALERGGSLLVADSRNHRIRRVTPAGVVTTVAGDGPAGGAGGKAEGPALEARFRYPSGVAAGPAGEIFIADTGNRRICRLQDGVVSVLAGGAGGATDGTGAAAGFQAPAALTVAPDGALWVLDAGDLRTRRVDASGTVTTPAAVPEPVQAALGETATKPQPILLSAWVERGTEPTLTAFQVARRSPGSMPPGLPRFFADTEHGSVFMQRPGGPPLLLAGRRPAAGAGALPSDGGGHRASFALPCSVARAPDGAIYVAEYEAHRIRRLRLPDWLLAGELEAPGRRRNWRGRRGS